MTNEIPAVPHKKIFEVVGPGPHGILHGLGQDVFVSVYDEYFRQRPASVTCRPECVEVTVGHFDLTEDPPQFKLGEVQKYRVVIIG